MNNKCDICGKSFRGHDPLTEGKRYFHTKCAPKHDVAGMKNGVEILLKQHGVDWITTSKKP